MKTDRNFFFLHGGPGFNSFSEEESLALLLQERGWSCKFWNEPSEQRPAGTPFQKDHAFTHLTASAAHAVREAFDQNGPVHLVAHSFATQTAGHLLKAIPDHFNALTLICPTFNLYRSYQKIMNLAICDFKQTQPSSAAAISKFLQETQSLMDPPMKEGFLLAAQDPKLFGHYWQNKEAMQNYFGAWQRKNTALDVVSFFAVLEDLARQDALGANPFQKADSLPIQVIFGKSDPICWIDEELSDLRQVLSPNRIVVFEKSGHFPHLEEPENFIETLETLEC